MNKPEFTAITTGLAMAALGTAAHAGQPLQTEDAAVLERGACEVEGRTLHVSGAGQRNTEDTLGLACGFGLNSQVGLGVSALRTGGERTRNAALGGKTGLWKSGEGDDAIALSLAWAVSADHAASGWRRSATDFSLVATWPVSAGAWHLNLGHHRRARPS